MFSINYNSELIINMEYKGKMLKSQRSSSINAQGWERNAKNISKNCLRFMKTGLHMITSAE